MPRTTPAEAAGRLTIHVSIARQELILLRDGKPLKKYVVSTAANGPGERSGSYCTPRGRHVVRARIGDGCPEGAVFIARRPTGEVYREGMREREPERDWILTRILWLSGCEPGRNRLGEVDTMRRYIYIHGTPDATTLGTPGSHGCIRMANADVIELFDAVPVGTPVLIDE